MGRFVFFLLLIFGAAMLVNRVGIQLPALGSTGVSESGRDVLLETGDLDVRFTSHGTFGDEFMLFGGAEMRQRNAISHALVTGLAGGHARLIASRYPDFHLCKSPGARPAQELAESMNLVAATASARNAIGDALSLHEERVRSGGNRTCLRVAGKRLTLDEVRVRQTGDDMTGQVTQAFGDVDFYLAREAQIVDCQSVLF